MKDTNIRCCFCGCLLKEKEVNQSPMVTDNEPACEDCYEIELENLANKGYYFD